ncbi:MAG: menaquinone biosynthesis protein [Bryobacteraceae bacterium]
MQPTRPRVSAVSYLNTVPLVWGLTHDPALRDVFDVNFALPSLCAQQMAAGQADIGILPVIEMARQKLDYFPGTGIACHGPVRTILLISKVPYAQIKTLAVDAGSRTSVMLSRVILAEQYGASPTTVAMPADMESMLAHADAALIIGDPALHIDPETIQYNCLDLGAEWVNMTGLPMVFAVWSARKELILDRYADAFRASCRYGLDHMDDIVTEQSPIRGISEELTRAYLTKHIVFELGEKDYEGMRRYLDLALRLDRATI